MTNNLDHLTMNEKKLEQLLDIYGADLSKMPEPFAKEVKDFLQQLQEGTSQGFDGEEEASGSQASTQKEKISELIEKAELLDQALDHHKQLPKWDIEALEGQILSKAFASEQASTANVISFDERKITIEKNKPSSIVGKLSGKSEFFTIKSTGLIAASLLAGLLIGSLGGLDHLLYEEGSTLIASNSLLDDVLYLGTEYSIDTAEFLNN
ncbi:hypothetical protein NBRC116602_27950 [Hyphomicrobiales bacterium 4NK60-0047b]